MKREQDFTILPRVRQFGTNGIPSSKPMVSPNLLNKLRNKGAILEETHIGVLGLSVFDIRRLEEAGIFNIKQLAVWYDTDIRTIPHFGVIKVRRLRSDLENYLNAMVRERNQEFDSQPEMPDTGTTDTDEPDYNAFHSSSRSNSDSELEAFSKSLNKLKRQLESLELRFARARTRIKERTLTGEDMISLG